MIMILVANQMAGRNEAIKITEIMDQGSDNQFANFTVIKIISITQSNLSGRRTALPLFIRMILMNDRKYQTIFDVQCFFHL